MAYVRSAQQTDALGASAQERLDQAAGGSDRVSAYCAQLTGIAAVGQGMSSITHLALPTDRGK